MKITVLMLATTMLFAGCAGVESIPESSKTFEKVVDAPGVTKDQIYVGVKIWIAETFKSSKAVIEVDSKADGLIIGNGIISYPCQGAMDCFHNQTHSVPFTMKIEIKDNKYKTTYSNIRVVIPGQAGVHPRTEAPIRAQADLDKIKPALLALTDKLTATINTKRATSDW